MPFVTSVLLPKEELVEKFQVGKWIGQNDPKSVETWQSHVVVLEQEPMKVNVVWKSKNAYEQPPGTPDKPAFVSYKIELPWTYFLTRFTLRGSITDAFLFISPKKVRPGTKDKLFLPLLPNIYPSGRICMGTIRTNVMQSMEERAKDIFRLFWKTPFTGEICPKDKLVYPKTLINHGVVYGQAWTFLPAWQAANKAKDAIDWKVFRYRHGRRAWRLTTMDQIVEYAAIFPHRDTFYF